MARYQVFNIMGDRIRTYTKMGKNVHMNNEFWRITFFNQ